MADTSAISAATATASASLGTTGTQSAATTTLGSSNPDFDRFLTLLTAQMKYQDPMQPTDPTQFVAQLAQFSQVEQQTKTNTLLQTIASSMTGVTLSGATQLIGKQVNATAKSVTVPASGNASALTVTVDQAQLKNTRLVVLDQSGSELRRIAVAAGTTQVTFDGNNTQGQRLPAGSYQIKVVGDDSKGVEQVAGSATGTGKVTEVRKEQDGYSLILQDGSVLDAGSVTTLTN